MKKQVVEDQHSGGRSKDFIDEELENLLDEDTRRLSQYIVSTNSFIKRKASGNAAEARILSAIRVETERC